MQTFLPDKNFRRSARILDMKRLGKQRVEAYQIINILEGRSKGWANHPCCRQWEGYEKALKYYCNCMIDEWVMRGYNNTMKKYIIPIILQPEEIPDWLGIEEYHSSHRSVLLYKNFEYYSQFGWNEAPEYKYFWPSKELVK